LFPCHLAGDLGTNRPVSSEIRGRIRQFGQSLEVDGDRHGPVPLSFAFEASGEKPDGDVCSKLVDGACFVGGLETPGEQVYVIASSQDVVRRALGDDERCGAFRVWLGDDFPF
jgi:hypothetical protein